MSKQSHVDATDELRPLVTFALFAYNQEKYIRKAIEGAFSQSYSPMEIILSDDYSTDRTFEIMKDMANHYSGSATIYLNENDSNFKLANHLNKVMSMARGKLLVLAAGDDVSLPNRTEVLVNAWLQAGRPPTSLSSSHYQINKEGEITALVDHRPAFEESLVGKVNQSPQITGATHAISAAVFETFGTINADVLCEDRAYYFRSSMLYSPIFIHEPLVLYRVHSDQVSPFSANKLSKEQRKKRTVLFYQGDIGLYRQYIKDLDSDYVRANFRKSDIDSAMAAAADLLAKSIYSYYFTIGSQKERVELLRKLLGRIDMMRYLKWGLRTALPRIDEWY